jgi:hypothetical protein
VEWAVTVPLAVVATVRIVVVAPAAVVTPAVTAALRDGERDRFSLRDSELPQPSTNTQMHNPGIARRRSGAAICAGNCREPLPTGQGPTRTRKARQTCCAPADVQLGNVTERRVVSVLADPAGIS